MLKGLPTSAAKIGRKESYASAAKGYNIKTLRLLFKCAVLFAVVGLGMFFFDKNQRLAGLGSGVFFGVSTLAIGYMIKIKKR